MAFRTLNSLEYEFYQRALEGTINFDLSKRTAIYDYNDAATWTTPIALTTPGTFYDLTNDGAGTYTYSDPFEDVADVWNTSTNSFDFSDLPVNSTIDIRLHVDVTTASNNTAVDIDLVVAEGTASEYSLPFIVEQNYKFAGSRQVIRYNGIYLGNDDTRLNPAKFKMKSDTAGTTVKVYGWYVKIHKP